MIELLRIAVNSFRARAILSSKIFDRVLTTTVWRVFVFREFLLRIFPPSGWIVQSWKLSPTAGKYGPKNSQYWHYSHSEHLWNYETESTVTKMYINTIKVLKTPLFIVLLLSVYFFSIFLATQFIISMYTRDFL